MQAGRIVEWNDARGYGFIAPEAGGADVFVHVSVFRTGRPRQGDRILYNPGIGRDGRPAARRARLERDATEATPDYFDRHAMRVWAAAALMIGVLATVVMDRVPVWMLAPYAIGGLASFALYGIDKQAARRGEWRVSEATLHGLDAAFGIIGGLLAQLIFRRKTSKPEFTAITGGIAILHAIGLAGFLSGAIAPSDVVAFPDGFT